MNIIIIVGDSSYLSLKRELRKKVCLEHSCVLILHIRQLLLLQGCCLEGLVQVLAWTYSQGKPALVMRLDL